MNFSAKYEGEIKKVTDVNKTGPYKYLWLLPDLAYTFRINTLSCCMCENKTGFRLIDDKCEVPICSDECLGTYKHMTSST